MSEVIKPTLTPEQKKQVIKDKEKKTVERQTILK